MCGRYAEFKQTQDLADAFARQGFLQDALFADGTHDWEPAWNIAPTHDIRIIVDRPFDPKAAESLVTATGTPALQLPQLVQAATQFETLLDNSSPSSTFRLPNAEASPSSGEVLEDLSDSLIRQVRRARWGLVPSWAKDPAIGSKMINARSETITEKPSFKKAFASRRCIIPADGFYEWTTIEGPPKQKFPNFITPADGSMFAFAGIYEFWKAPDQSQSSETTMASVQHSPWLVTASIITTESIGEMATIHSRSPIFLTPENYNAWLSPHTTVEQALEILALPPNEISHHVVSSEVNKVSNRGPHLILPTS